MADNSVPVTPAAIAEDLPIPSDLKTIRKYARKLKASGEIPNLKKLTGRNGKRQTSARDSVKKRRKNTKADIKRRVSSTHLYLGDCLEWLPTLRANSVDLALTDPIYPCVKRDYGFIKEDEWLEMMMVVVK